jgi:hypothetical protein
VSGAKKLRVTFFDGTEADAVVIGVQPEKDLAVLKPAKIPDTYDSFDMHFDYHAVVNYCSGPGIQAAISGTRPIVGTYSLAAPVSVEVENLDQPYTTDRDQWLVEICHTEYTVKEIEQGVWIHRLKL